MPDNEEFENIVAGMRGSGVQVTQGVPPMRVVVNPGNQIGHEGTTYLEGEEVELPSPGAQALILGGYCSPVV